MNAISHLFLFALLLATRPQEPVVVDVERDFPGIVQAWDSEYREFYPITRFQDFHGKKVTPSDLADLKREWAAERKKGDEKRDAIEGDPEQYYLFHLDQRLRRRASYFRDLDFERVDDFKPFYLFVQKSKKPGGASFPRTVADFYGPWLKELLRLFEEQYARPLGLQRRKEHGAFALLVLNDRKAYDAYYARLGLGYAPYARAHYDPDLQLGVTYEEPGSLAVSPEERRKPALHEMVHAFEFAYGPGKSEALQVTWFAEGFADYLGFHEGQDPGGLGRRPINGQYLHAFVDAASDSAKKSPLFPFAELTALRGYEEAVQRAWGRSDALKLEQPDPGTTLGLLYSSSYLWMHFLHHGEGGKYRDGIRSYVGAAISNSLAEKPLSDFFQGTKPEELDAAFLVYIASEWKRSESAAAAPALPALQAVDLLEGPRGVTVATGPKAPKLVIEPELELAAALGEARVGRMEAAAARLRPLAVRSDAGALRQRAQRELERVEATLQVRQHFFEELATRKEPKLRLPPEFRDRLATVEAVEGSVVRLGKNNANAAELVLEELAPSYLARELGDGKRYEFSRPGWVLGYLELLAGSAAWRKTLERCADPEARTLLADAESDLPARLALAEPARVLVDLAGKGEGSTPAESQAVFEGIAKLLREQPTAPLVQSRREALLGRARAALARLYAEQNPAELLRGRWEDLGEGRLRLSYGFDSETELQDFEIEPLEELEDLPEGLVLTDTRIEKSALQALGFCRLWNHVQLAAPIEVIYEFTEWNHEITLANMRGQIPPYLTVGLLARSRQDHLAIHELDGIEDIENGRTLRRPTRIEEARNGKKFKLVVSVAENGRVSLTVNNQAGRQASSRPSRSGATFLETMGRVEIHSFSIAGRRTEDTLAHWREAWIDERLAAAGLK